MGLNTWAAFLGTDTNAEIAGDLAMPPGKVRPTLKALRENGLNVVAIHNRTDRWATNHLFLHYWGTGPAEKLARGLKPRSMNWANSTRLTGARHRPRPGRREVSGRCSAEALGFWRQGRSARTAHRLT
jgi:hypothetical protein